MSIIALLTPNTHIAYTESSYDNCFHHKEPKLQHHQRELLQSSSPSSSSITNKNKIIITRRRNSRKLDWKTYAFLPESRPAVLEMQPILDSEQLDQALIMAQDLSQPIIIDWMASWCRKCIYLKPKLEKLAAEYDAKIKFYYVDVNKVSQALVKRGNVSKMPTIQLWKDGEKKAEVIGGHKAWLVVEEVREMMQQYLQ